MRCKNKLESLVSRKKIRYGVGVFLLFLWGFAEIFIVFGEGGGVFEGEGASRDEAMRGQQIYCNATPSLR